MEGIVFVLLLAAAALFAFLLGMLCVAWLVGFWDLSSAFYGHNLKNTCTCVNFSGICFLAENVSSI